MSDLERPPRGPASEGETTFPASEAPTAAWTPVSPASAWEPESPTPSWAAEASGDHTATGHLASPVASRPRKHRFALLLALVGLLAGLLGGGIVAAVNRSSATTQTSGAGPKGGTSAAPAAAAGTAAAALAAIEPAVVAITATVDNSGNGFGGAGSAAGTGIIISPSGEVVTNAHVVANATSIRVQIPGRSGTTPATVVGADTAGDLALLKLQGVSGLPTATFAATSTVHVGDPVLAVGNAEGYGGAPTVTEGIISALNRELPDDSNASGGLKGLLQTDAAINPGNSGGALVDSAGRVVGITTAVATGGRSTPTQNIGFVIPSDAVLKALPSLRAGQGATGGNGQGATSGAFLGVGLTDGQAGAGAAVGSVVAGGPAAKAGLAAGDVITAVDGDKITGAVDLRAVLAKHSPGDRITVSWLPGGQGPAKSATVTLATRPTSAG